MHVKICYVVDNISFRGGERTFAQLVLGLDSRHYEIHAICSPGGRFVDVLETAGVPVFPVDMRNKWNLPGLLPMTRYLRQHRFDIVHTQGRGDPFGRIAARLAGVPLVISTPAMIVSRYWGAGLGRRLLYRIIDRVTDPLVDQCIVVNHESVDTLVRDHGVPRDRIAVILNGIEFERYAPSPAARAAWRGRWHLSDDEPAVGAIGKLTWQKGFEYLIRAWPQVRAQVPNARLFILGEGELESELKTLAAELGVAGSCTFTGFEPNVPEALAGLDVFALPSLVEGLPMVLLEAMAAGKPIVASRIAGSLEAITDGLDGLLATAGDADALAALLIELIRSPHLAAQLSAAAQHTARQRFTVERMVRETEALYQRLLAQRRANATQQRSAPARRQPSL